MRRIVDKILYCLLYEILFLIALLPFRVLYLFSDLLYFLVAHIIRYRRKVVFKNLSTSFPEKSKEDVIIIQKRFYHWFCDYIVETIKLMTMTERQLRKRMRFEGMEEFNKVLDSGQSCALYLGHYCNWEWISSVPLWLPNGVQSCQLYHPLENKIFNKLFKSLRERQNSLCIPMKLSLRCILEFKKSNKSIAVGYIADQAPMWNNIHHWLNFLHHDTPVFTGAERIIKHTNQICFYGDMRRIKRGYYVCKMIPMTYISSKDTNWELTDKYYKLLEKTIKRQPELWLWSHNRWKRTRKEYNRLMLSGLYPNKIK